jgi:hypothetical protein
MPLIDFKSNLSNFRKVIKPKPEAGATTPAVPFGDYVPISNNLNDYADDRYQFSTKKLESFERKKVNEGYEPDSILKNNSVFDNINDETKDLKNSRVVDYTQEPNKQFGSTRNNEESPVRINDFSNKQDKEQQAKTVQKVSQDDKIVDLTSKYELRNKINVSDPKRLETISSKYDIDGAPSKFINGGLYETEKLSKYGFLAGNKPEVDAFSNTFSSGFKIKNGANFTGNAFQYAWSGGKDSAPNVDFFSNEYVFGGFKKFQKLNQTNFKLDKLPSPGAVDYFPNTYSKNFTQKQKETAFTSTALNYIRLTAVDAFDNRYNKNFIINAKQYQTGFTPLALNFGISKLSTTNYFDLNKNFTISGFTRNQQLLQTDFNKSALDWGLKGTTPATDFFDIGKAFTNGGFIIKQQPLVTDFTAAALDWGLNGKNPSTNFFDISKTFTISGFRIRQRLLQTDFNPIALDWGLKGKYPTTDFFDLSNTFTNTGFTFKQPLLQTDFNAAALDWGLKGLYPTTDFFDISKTFTNTGFTFRQPLLQTDFNASALDWGLKGLNPTTDFFDIGKTFTISGFTFRQPLLQTDFNASALDWGLKGTNPATDFFDIAKTFTNTGFTINQQLLVTDFNASALDWGLKGTTPNVNFFDTLRQFTIAGFISRQQPLVTDFNATALDWGLKGTTPNVNFFDTLRQFTIAGFISRQQPLVTDFNATALDWGLQGTNPATDFFDVTKQYTTSGFVIRQPLLTTDFTAAALDWGLQGTNPATDFFDVTRQYTVSGFVIRQPLLTSDFTAAALDWGLQGTNPVTDFFDIRKQYTIGGFVARQPLLTTDFNANALDWGLQGTNPATNFFDVTRQYTVSGFVINQPLFTTDFTAQALDWGLQGTNPVTDFFDINKQYTISGFVARQSLLQTDFNASALDWGLQGTNPATNFFDITRQYTAAGFVIRQPLRTTDYTTRALDYSLFNIPPLENGQPSAVITTLNNKQYGEVNFFDLGNINTTQGFHVLARPLEPTKYKTNSTRFFVVPASDFEIPRIGSPNYRIDAQLVKSPIFSNLGFIKQNNNTYVELIRSRNYGSFLGDVSDTQGSPTLLDIQYEKYHLKDESYNAASGIIPSALDLVKQFTDSQQVDAVTNLLGDSNYNIFDSRQPYIIRGIQQKGSVENERWGFGINLDEGLIRGGAVTAAERSLYDALRITKFALSPRGLLFTVKQLGLQLSNPNVEGSLRLDRLISGTSTKNYSFKSLITSPLLNAFGYHPVRSGTANKYGDVIKSKSADFDSDPIGSNRNAEIAEEFNLLTSDEIEPGLSGGSFTKTGGINNVVSGITGPGSLYGIGYTIMTRNSTSYPEGTFIRYNTTYQYSSPLSNSSTKSKDLYIGQREYPDNTRTISQLKNIYLAFQGQLNHNLLFKGEVGDATPLGPGKKKFFDKHLLNFGLDGDNDATKYIDTLSSTIPGIRPSDYDLYSPHTLRNPLPYSKGGDKDSLSNGAWVKDPNINRPFISELEKYGIISKRQKGYYAPFEITLGKNATPDKSSLLLYGDSSVIAESSVAQIGPMSPDGINALTQDKDYKLSALFYILTNYANDYPSISDITGLNLSPDQSYDQDDNIDINFYLKNLLNPFNKFIIDKQTASDVSSDGFVNINKRATQVASTNASMFKHSAIKEYAVMKYTDILGDGIDSNRSNVKVTSIQTTQSQPQVIGKVGGVFITDQMAGTPGKKISKNVLADKPLNNSRFHDFRYKVQPLIEGTPGNYYPSAKAGRINFISNPEILKYRSNNLEDAAGFGQHGMPGVDRTNPVLSFLCGRVSNGYRDLRGDQYGGIHKFRGDRVNLVDFRHDKSTTDINRIYELGDNSRIPGQKDLIEFYVTGMNAKDRVIVFRATLGEVQDNFSPSWETVKYLNRADPVYLYRGFEREVSVNFTVGITSRDELRTRWRSLNALAGFTAPEYINSNDPTFDGRMKAPLMKITLGHLFRSTPCIITGLTYSFDNSQVVWETAKLTRWVNGKEIVETITTDDLDDPACCVALQLPKMINVSMTLKIIGNYRPQSNGGSTGYPDMGIFYNLYASDDSRSDGLLPRKGGIYVNYMNRECTVIVDKKEIQDQPPKTTPTPPLVPSNQPGKEKLKIQDIAAKDPPKTPVAVTGSIPAPPPVTGSATPQVEKLKISELGEKDKKQKTLTKTKSGATNTAQPTRGKTGSVGTTNAKDVDATSNPSTAQTGGPIQQTREATIARMRQLRP